MTEDELLNMPISAIEDGWMLKDSDKLYLFVRVRPNLVQTITIDRKHSLT